MIVVKRQTLPAAWEEAVLDCWQKGHLMPTQYDKVGDPPSRDCTAVIEVACPMMEPRIHKNIPGGLNDLEKYRAEVIYGVHDHWVDVSDPAKWQYTYHGRLDAQISEIIKRLKENGSTRQALASTWYWERDLRIKDPPCVQYLWFRIVDGKLNLNLHIRSNDAYKAAFMNMWAFTEWQAYIAGLLGVGVGTYIHVADSFHIYGSYFSEFGRWLEQIKKTTLADRVFTTGQASPMLVDGIDELLTGDICHGRGGLLRRKHVLELQ